MSTEQNHMQPTKQKRTKKELPVCQICDEKLNKSTHLLISCEYCNFQACRKCCETYATNETTVKCMNTSCGRAWTRKFIREVFTLVFINGQLKQHREQLLFDRERALLPATQPIIEGKIACAKIDKNIEDIRREVSRLHSQITELYREKNNITTNPRRNAERAAFIRACPDEDCRGFLSTQWKCGICEKWTCPDCHIIKGYTRDADHVCNPDDLATAQLLANDTKPCPKCATGIFKIDGCDQMWCTQCHTAFSWRTGAIQNNIHNPHYYEWLRRTNGGEAPRNPGDVPCGREVNHHLFDTISRTIRTKYRDSPIAKRCISKCDDIIRRTVHLNYAERPQPANYERANEALRVKYLMKEITEEAMKEQLQRDDKRHNKIQELADIFQVVSNTVADIMYRFLDYLQSSIEGSELSMDILDEIHPLIKYANECLSDVSYTYSCSKIVFGPNIQLYRGTSAERYLKEQHATSDETQPV